jgi:zinc protease
MTKKFYVTFLALALALGATAQKVNFVEYDLKNGLHVVLQQNKTAPVVAVGVMYHVGSKDENPERTGFAHFFEHLLFEGSKNIKRGEFMKLVSAAGGTNNANTTHDRTFYFEKLPSNELETGLWLESERMLHPIINEIGVSTQKEVVKEEKRLRVDNQPYGNFLLEVTQRLFKVHPYRWAPIGSMEHLNAATLQEFLAFNKKFYGPTNAVLVVTGDLDIAKTKKLIDAYFGPIPASTKVTKQKFVEAPLGKQIIDTAYDANIQVPAIVAAYRIPGMTSTESTALEMASAVLSGGASSRIYKKMVDIKANSLAVGSQNLALEDYGIYFNYALPSGEVALDTLLLDMDVETEKLKTELITIEEFTKIQNQFENAFLDKNNNVLGVAENLANGYTFFNKNTNYLNTELAAIRKITREDIRNAVKKYLNPNERVVIYYLPKKG